MDLKTYKKLRLLVAIFVSITVSIATIQNSFILAVVGVLTGMLFMGLARSKTKITVDERDQLVREQAAQISYAVFTPVIGLGSFFLTFFGRMQGFGYLVSLGMVLAYLTLFLIALYSLAYYFLNRKYSGGGEGD